MNLLTCALAAAAMSSSVAVSGNAPKMEIWQDPGVFEMNRLPMRATFQTDQQKTLTLDGVWKFQLCQSPAERTKDFFSEKFNDSAWGTIPVPGLWELNGYGDPLYVNVGYAWRGHFENNPPYVPEERNYVGQYRRTLTCRLTGQAVRSACVSVPPHPMSVSG